MTNDIQQSRYDQLIRRVGGIIGPGSKVAEVITELFPMIDVENVPGELLILAGTNIAFGGSTQASTGAETPKGQLFNPAESGMLITVEQAWASSPSVGIIQWGVTDTALLSQVVVGTYRDTRKFVPNRPVGEIRGDSTVGAPPVPMSTRYIGNTALTLENRNGVAVLSPGFGFSIGHDLATATLLFGFVWRERVAEQSELNL